LDTANKKKLMARWVPAGAMLAVALAGCDNLAPRRDTLGKIDTAIEAPAASAPPGPATGPATAQSVPAEVADALLPSVRLTAPEIPKVTDTQRFDISVNEVPAAQFFMSLVDGTLYNMVVHPEVAGSITLNLKNVGIPDVLEAARDVYGYEFVQTGYGFQVLPARLEARVYQINYLNVSRSGQSSTFVSSGTLQQAPGINEGSADSANESGGTGGEQQRAVVGTRISTAQPETTFWTELQTAVQAIVGEGQGRSVVVSPQSGVVVARALPNELREVEAFLRATQLIAQRQVILETKILEVELSEGYQTGINWTGLFGDFTPMQIGGDALTNETGVGGSSGSTVTLAPGVAEIAGAVAPVFGGVFALAVNSNDFAAFIELLKTQGNVQVLSSPRISTMNNQKALIKVGTDEFFVTDISTTTVTGTATTSTPNVELTPFFSGIALDVTPQISEGGEVTLHIHPSVSQVTEQQKEISVGGASQSFPLAKSTVRESDSIVRARSGQVVVIGGLMQDRTNDRDAKTPILGDLPVIGGLFGHKLTSTVKSELVILMRPVVIDAADRWSEATQSSAQNFRRMREQLDKWAAERRSGAPALGPTAP
jgi:MSHA biogenesis protein MshL